jgi:hypothetical protein
MFFVEINEHFEEVDAPGGKIIKFKGNKNKFATKIVPNLPKESFEVFRPMFEFIKSKC